MANEKRLIDANKLKDRFKLRLAWLEKDLYDEYTKGLYHGCDYDMTLINEQPTVDAVEVVHGWWENITDYGGGNCFGYCSNCKTPIKSNNRTALIMDNVYCRYCGAKMDGDGNG